jgi:predicted transport protein
MPLFKIEKDRVELVLQNDFRSEKELQTLVQRNLGPIFNCRLVAEEFSTGERHAGRIDTLALSEDNNPVIIEYKKVESSDLINQSLFYLSWLYDHRGDFELAAQKALGKDVQIDWSDIRVICIAPNFRKYDMHAIQVMNRNIELWRYRRFANNVFELEEVFKQEEQAVASVSTGGKNPVMVAAGKKAAATRAIGGWSFQKHLEGKPAGIRNLMEMVQDFMTGLDAAVEESPKKFYVAYRTTQNIVCMEPQQQKVTLFVKLDPKSVKGPAGISRDVSDVGHYGTGDLAITLKVPADFEAAKPFLKQAYEEAGG